MALNPLQEADAWGVPCSYAVEPMLEAYVAYNVRPCWRFDDMLSPITAAFPSGFVEQESIRRLWHYLTEMCRLGSWRQHPFEPIDPAMMRTEGGLSQSFVVGNVEGITVGDVVDCMRFRLSTSRWMSLELNLRRRLDRGAEGRQSLLILWCCVFWVLRGVDAVCPVVYRILRAESRQRGILERGCVNRAYGDADDVEDWERILEGVSEAASGLVEYNYMRLCAGHPRWIYVRGWGEQQLRICCAQGRIAARPAELEDARAIEPALGKMVLYG
jgi:hypothetical protein